MYICLNIVGIMLDFYNKKCSYSRNDFFIMCGYIKCCKNIIVGE